MKTFASIIVMLSLMLGQLTPVLAQGADPETPTPTETTTEEPTPTTDIPTPSATSTPIPETGTPTTEIPVTQTTPTAPLTETAASMVTPTLTATPGETGTMTPAITLTPSSTSTVTPALTAAPGAASALTLSLTSTPGFIKANGNVTIQWEIIGLLEKARISGLTLKVLLPEGVEPGENFKEGSFDETSRMLSLTVKKPQGKFQLRTDQDSQDLLLSVELLKGEETQATAELLIPQKETFDVKQKGGFIRALDNKLKVTLPAGALPEDATIDIGSPTKDSAPRYSLSGRPFEIKAHGKSNKSEIREFGKKIEFEAQYGDLNISESDEQYLQLYWYNPETQEWEILPSWVDKKNKAVHGLTTHFSVFDIGVNNWNASRLPTIDAFQVSTFTGAATYSMPIEVPPGPGGLQPDLTLSYNSQVIDQATIQTQASWVGMGWSLGGGSIFPIQDGGFILSLGGVGTILRTDTSDTGIWHAYANDENFWRITLTGSGWEIHDKQGNTYYFGESATAYEIRDVYLNIRSETVGWYLTKIRNIHGQEINFTYVKQTKDIVGKPNGNTHYPSVTAVYLDTITYGGYRIRFVRGARTDYTAAWDTDAGIHLFEKERLINIRVERSDGTLIRRYQFDYAAPTDSDQIWPNVTYTAGGNGGKVSTLRSVTQYGTDNLTNLPAVTFTYDKLHLTSADNGYGGIVNFVYETTPYFATTPRPSYDKSNGFCGSTWPGHFGWSNVSCTRDEESGDRNRNVYGLATTSSYDPNMTRPGGVYFVGTDLLSGTLSVGLYNGLAYQTIASNYAVITLSPDANNADPVMYSASSATIGSHFFYQLLASFYRVTRKTVYDGNGNAYPFSYAYDGPFVSPNGQLCIPNTGPCVMDAEAYSEFRGHSSVTETGPDGRKTVTYFYQDDILKGRPSSVTVYSPSWAPLTQSIYTYASTPLPVYFSNSVNGYGHYWVRQTSQENRIYANNGTYSATLSSYTYDPANGNPLTQTDASWNGSGWVNYRVARTDYVPNTGAPYLVGLPALQQVMDANLNVLDQSLYLYDGANTYNVMPAAGKLTAVRRLMNTGQYAQTSYGYDAWGNQTSVTNYTGYGSASSTPTVGAQTTSTVYDPTYHTYPLSITNAKNQTTTLTYDYTKGVPLSEMDANNQTTSATYDVLGRLTSLTRPLDAAPSLTIAYQDSFPFTTSITQKIDASTNYTLTRQYDGMGRETRTNAGGILTDMTYDAYGRVTSKSTPYQSGENAYYTSTVYDALGRPTVVTAPDGSGTSYSYDGLISALTDANYNTTITTNDVWGRTVSVVPQTGPDVSYSYDAEGQLLSVTRGGATSTMTYTYGGQKSSMSDPDMGNWGYSYDALASLTTQTDARGCVTSLGYDALNRPLNKSSSGSGCGTQASASFGYDSGANGIGRRTSMSDASGSASWTYDARGRMTSETKTITGQTFTTQWTYNLADLPVSMTYPDGEVVTNTYNDRMLLNSVIGSAVYVNSTSYDSAGRTTARALGNTQTQSFTYNAWTVQGGRLQSLTTGALQNLNYTYDTSGNILRIRNNAAGEISSYSYDSLDRLTDWNLSSAGSMDETPPVVTSITRKDPNPTAASSVDFNVTFSEPVSGVDVSAPFNDFVVTTTNITGASISGVSGSGASYTVRVNTGAGSGTIQLGVYDNDTIKDGTFNPLGGAGMGNGSFAGTSQPYTIDKDVKVYIGGSLAGSHYLPQGGSTRQNYAGVDSGPVKVVSPYGTPIIAGLRDAWAVNGVTTSFSQLMGLPPSQVSDKYIFPAYNNVTLDEQLRIANIDTVSSTVTVTIGGVVRGTYTLGPNGTVRVNYAGLDSGPVVVQGTAGVKIIAAIREAWAVNGVTKSFVQLMGLPATQLSNKYVFPAYNNVTLNEQLRIANVDTVPSTVTVTIGGVLQGTYTLGPNGVVRVNYAGVDSGPVVVQGTPNVKIIAAVRDAWAVNGVTTSFSQLMGLPAGQLSNKYVFPAYNNVTLNEQLRIANVDTVTSTVTVTIGGVVQGTYTLGPNGVVRVNYAGVDSGPLVVEGTPNVKIIAGIRDAWTSNGVITSFTQLMGLPAEQLSTTVWFPAYNNVTLDEQLRIGASQQSAIPPLPPSPPAAGPYTSYDSVTGNIASKAGVNYTYNAAHKHAVASLSNGNTYGYDANGNQTMRVINGQTYTLGYDAENHLVSVSGPSTAAAFVYDGDGNRVKSTINGVTTYFVGSHYEVTGSTVTKYYFAGSTRIAMRTGSTVSYLLTDHLGSTSLTTNASGALISELRYKPWGEVRYSNGTTSTRYTYTGQYSNVSDFGLYFYNARWYDPALSRFTQADSIVPGGVQGLDRYAYVNNSPVRYNDPSGHMQADIDHDTIDLRARNRYGISTTRDGHRSNGGWITSNHPSIGPWTSPTATPTLSGIFTPDAYGCSYGPQRACITSTAFAAGTPTPSATPTATPTYYPTPFGIPATPFSDRFKTGIAEGYPNVRGNPSQILNPGYSAAISDSMTEIEIYIRLVGGWGASNAPLITDYLYGTQLIKDIGNKWLSFTGNNNLIIPPLPLPYLLENSTYWEVRESTIID